MGARRAAMNMGRRLQFLVVALSAVAALVGSSAGATPPQTLTLGQGTREIIMPAEWAGIWQTQTDKVDCETLAVLHSSTVDDTTCAGDVFSYDSGEGDFTCTESVNGNTVSISCSGQFPLDEGCDIVSQFDLTITRNGDSFEGVQILTQTTQGEGCEFPFSMCDRYELTGTRIGPPPASCVTPVETRAWSTIKVLYN
jgi:hypothetical protein